MTCSHSTPRSSRAVSQRAGPAHLRRLGGAARAHARDPLISGRLPESFARLRRRGVSWRGKTFRPRHEHAGHGINRVVSNAFEIYASRRSSGHLARATSTRATQLRPAREPFFIRAVKDEIREIAPGLWLVRHMRRSARRRIWCCISGSPSDEAHGCVRRYGSPTTAIGRCASVTRPSPSSPIETRPARHATASSQRARVTRPRAIDETSVHLASPRHRLAFDLAPETTDGARREPPQVYPSPAAICTAPCAPSIRTTEDPGATGVPYALDPRPKEHVTLARSYACVRPPGGDLHRVCHTSMLRASHSRSFGWGRACRHAHRPAQRIATPERAREHPPCPTRSHHEAPERAPDRAALRCSRSRPNTRRHRRDGARRHRIRRLRCSRRR